MWVYKCTHLWLKVFFLNNLPGAEVVVLIQCLAGGTPQSPLGRLLGFTVYREILQ